MKQLNFPPLLYWKTLSMGFPQISQSGKCLPSLLDITVTMGSLNDLHAVHENKPCTSFLLAKVSFFFFLSVFLGLHPQHMEVPRLGVNLELQLPAYTTATATQDQSHVCHLHHSSQHRQILNPQSEVKD